MLFEYSVKAEVDPEEMVIFILSISLVNLVGMSTRHVSVISIAETEAGLPTNLSNLNCTSKVGVSTITCADAGWEISQRNHV